MGCEAWLTVEDLDCAAVPPDGTTPEEWSARLALSLQLASQILEGVSGFGVCEITEHPCRDTADVCPCDCRSRARCTHEGLLDLRTPVVSISEVTINGTSIPLEDLQIHGGRWLRRISAPWPPQITMDTSTVTYRYGVEPDDLARRVLATLACRWAAPNGTCRPPDRAIQVSRRGITTKLQDPDQPILNRFRTGDQLVDYWIDTQIIRNETSGWELTTPTDPDAVTWHVIDPVF